MSVAQICLTTGEHKVAEKRALSSFKRKELSQARPKFKQNIEINTNGIMPSE